jgi:hypothetical protein
MSETLKVLILTEIIIICLLRIPSTNLNLLMSP